MSVFQVSPPIFFAYFNKCALFRFIFMLFLHSWGELRKILLLARIILRLGMPEFIIFSALLCQ